MISMKTSACLQKLAFMMAISLSLFSCSRDMAKDDMANMSTNVDKNVSAASLRGGPITGNGVNDLPQTVGEQKDIYYIVSKHSNRALTKVPIGQQIVQTELADQNPPSSQADLTIYYKQNDIVSGVTRAAYKLQWGNLNTLTNSFWDLENSTTADGGRILTWNSVVGANQNFYFSVTGDADGSVYIQNASSGKYLQIGGSANTSSGAVLQQNSFTGQSIQKFFIKKRP